MAKETYIRLRCTEDFKAQVEALAKKDNRTVSNYIENLLINEIKGDKNMRKHTQELEWNGKKYFIGDASVNDDGTSYSAPAEDEEGNEYTVLWYTTEEWDRQAEEMKERYNEAYEKGHGSITNQEDQEISGDYPMLEDGENACEWDKPYSITLND